MSLLRFLGTYFRPYLGQVGLAVLAALVYAVCSVLMLVVFQMVLSDVVQTDRSLQDLVGGGASDASDPGDQDAVDPEGLLPIDLQDLDLHGRLLEGYESLKTWLGVDETSVVYFVPMLMILVVAFRSLARFANGYLFQIIGLGATNDLRNHLYERLLHQSSNFYSRHPSGEILSRIGNDIGVLQNAVSTRFVDFFQQVPTFIGILWFLLSLNLELTLIVFLVVPAIALPIVQFGKGMRKTSHKSQERLADLSNLVAEAVRGHRVVKAFGMEDFELKRFGEATARHLRVKLRAQLLAYASGPVIETLAVIGAGGFLIFAGQAVRKGELTASVLVTFLVAVLSLYDPIRKLNKVNLVLQEALAAAHRVRDIIEAPNEIVSRPDAPALPAIEQQIRFDGVSFAYDQESVLKGIDLTIPRGQVVALVGFTGAGKSTLVNLLPRFFDPTEGRVEIDGMDLRDVSLGSLRSQIGLVTQDTVLFNDTVRNNIAYGRADASMDKVKAAARAAYADGFIEEMKDGYNTRVGESGANLSGGQRQRLAIARALFKDPPILILDEATSHLDSEAESLVQKALYNLMSGRTALVIAHRLSTIQRADRILVMNEGQVVEEGTHEQLLNQEGIYRRLHDLQLQEGDRSDA